MSSITTSVSELLLIYQSNVTLINQLNVNDVNSTSIFLLKSYVDQTYHIHMNNVSQCMMFKHSNVSMLSGSSFIQCGSESVYSGGAIEIIDSNVHVANSSFTHNMAGTGGAISIECVNYEHCDNQVYDSVFRNNSGTVKGGAISYDFRRPHFINNTYTDNHAPYGSNIASYAVRIVD